MQWGRGTSTGSPNPAIFLNPGGGIAVQQPALLLCPTCGNRDTGPRCSVCGEEMVPVAPTVSNSVMEHVIAEPLVEVMALLKTSWLMLTSPVLFFREVLVRNGFLASRPFFLAPLWRLVSKRPQKVLDPVKYLILAYGVTLFMSWVSGGTAPHEEINIPDWAWELIQVVTAVVMVALYSFALSLMLGGRIASAALTRFMLYLNGLVMAVLAFVSPFLASPPAVLAALLLVLHVIIVIPYVVLPRLFGITRKHLFAAQFGALALIVGAVVLILTPLVAWLTAAGK
ncbi:MAG TPA: hypothetical protein VFQ76_20760, partial [Longimicrobiaceae bacterium]|nr:hypothetical protein [Longimicrobiaceae bacterium]